MNSSRRTQLGAVLTAALWLSGCATPARQLPPEAAFWAGRIAVQIQPEPAQSLRAAFELQGSATQGALHLLRPIGSTLAQLNWTPENAKLSQGAHQWSGTSLDELTTRLTGTPLPMAALFDWLAGQATAPAGWQVDLSQWAKGRIQAERQSPAPAVQLKLVLER